jgi:hypothetical protein
MPLPRRRVASVEGQVVGARHDVARPPTAATHAQPVGCNRLPHNVFELVPVCPEVRVVGAASGALHAVGGEPTSTAANADFHAGGSTQQFS